MIEVGRVCIKLAGRDAGREAIIVDILDGNFVLIDGNVRRRKCNIMHLEPTKMLIKINKKASHDTIKEEFLKQNMGVWETKSRKTSDRPKKQRKVKIKEVKSEKKKAPLKKDLKGYIVKNDKNSSESKKSSVKKSVSKKVSAEKLDPSLLKEKSESNVKKV